jgi:hypothetical protein
LFEKQEAAKRAHSAHSRKVKGQAFCKKCVISKQSRDYIAADGIIVTKDSYPFNKNL